MTNTKASNTEVSPSITLTDEPLSSLPVYVSTVREPQSHAESRRLEITLPCEARASFMRLSDPELQKLRDELLDLKFKSAADTIGIQVTGIMLAAVWLMLMIEHAMR